MRSHSCTLENIVAYYSSKPKWTFTDLFEVPEAPKEVVPEKKVSVVPPKKPEAPPAKGTCHWPEAS
jgi:hypothetical protein